MGDGDAGLEALVVKVREHLLYEARLLRIDGDLDAAERTLALAGTLPDYPFADESRLDFNEPVEELRLAIARGQFAAAIDAATLIAQTAKEVLGVYRLDFGVPEAFWMIRVRDFPAVVTMDTHRKSLHDGILAASQQELDRLLAGP